MCAYSISKRTGRPPNLPSPNSTSPTESKATVSTGKYQFTASAKGTTSQKDCGRANIENDTNEDWIHSRPVVSQGGEQQTGGSRYPERVNMTAEHPMEQPGPSLQMSGFGEDRSRLQPCFSSLLENHSLVNSEAAGMPNFFTFSAGEEETGSSLVEQEFGAFFNSDAREQAMNFEHFSIGSDFPSAQTSPPMAMDVTMTTAPSLSNEARMDPAQSNSMGMSDSLSPSFYRPLSPSQVLDSSPSSLEAAQFLSSTSRGSSNSLDLRPNKCGTAKNESKTTSFDSSDNPSSLSNKIKEVEKKHSPGVDGRVSPSSTEAQQQRMQHLSELDMRLHSQLLNVNAESQVANFEGPELSSQFVGGILESSATFLKILKSFYPMTRSASSQERPAASVDPKCAMSRPSSRSPSDMSDSSDAAIECSSTRRPPRFENKGASNPQGPATKAVSTTIRPDNNLNAGSSNECPKPVPAPADMATTLQLLTCCIRIIHLHSILYSKSLAYLDALPAGSHQPPPIFPGIRVGGVALDGFGGFQMKLLLQISTHMLGEIEMALGLPNGYRISKKNEGVCGILENSVSVAFIEMTMRESERTTGFGVERDRTAAIRSDLAGLRLKLKGTINI